MQNPHFFFKMMDDKLINSVPVLSLAELIQNFCLSNQGLSSISIWICFLISTIEVCIILS